MSNHPPPSFSPLRKENISFLYMDGIKANEQEFDLIESLLESPREKEEKALMHIYQELFDRVVILEEMLTEKEKRESKLGLYLMYSLLTEDPIRTLDGVIYHYRNLNSKSKIVTLVSRFFKGDPIVSISLLSILIKDTEHYKNVIKFQS